MIDEQPRQIEQPRHPRDDADDVERLDPEKGTAPRKSNVMRWPAARVRRARAAPASYGTGPRRAPAAPRRRHAARSRGSPSPPRGRPGAGQAVLDHHAFGRRPTPSAARGGEKQVGRRLAARPTSRWLWTRPATRSADPDAGELRRPSPRATSSTRPARAGRARRRVQRLDRARDRDGLATAPSTRSGITRCLPVGGTGDRASPR